MIRITNALYQLASSGRRADLQKALQAAVELEHSTMPPYLYAMYSLGDNNRSVARVLYSIVIEEMTHMLLAANLLKSIGGHPRIAFPGFVPAYPSRLPGSVADGFHVPLRRMSRALTEEVFMRIEEPDSPLDFPVVTHFAPDESLPPSRTIGEFYSRIRQVFEQYGNELIIDTSGESQPVSDEPRLGVSEDAQRITSTAKALAAIDLIVEQGEGTSTSPYSDPEDDESNFAHYYRFAEIVRGTIEPNPDATPTSPPNERFVYNEGNPVDFDESLVFPFPDTPKAADYAEGSEQRIAMDAFNSSYSDMLRKLDSAFNTQPDDTPSASEVLADAIDLMRGDLADAALDLQDLQIGPSFEFVS